MYGDEQNREEKILSWRSMGASLGLHALLFAVIWAGGCALTREPEVVIPIDMTIVPPWAEQTNDPDPDPNPPPKPEPMPKPEPPKPKVEPPKPKIEEPKIEEPKPRVEEPPKLDETKQDAVVQEKPKPKPKKPEVKKPEVKKGDFLKDAKLVKTPPKKEEPKDFRKNAKLVKAPQIRKTGKATAADKPMTPEEFAKLMNQGYKIGARNQLAPNEESRCASLVAAALKRHWVDEFHWTEGMVSVYLEIMFGPGGRLRSFRIVRSSGDSQVDRSVLAAARATGSVPGLSPDFVRKYSGTPFVLEMKPVRQ